MLNLKAAGVWTFCDMTSCGTGRHACVSTGMPACVAFYETALWLQLWVFLSQATLNKWTCWGKTIQAGMPVLRVLSRVVLFCREPTATQARMPVLHGALSPKMCKSRCPHECGHGTLKRALRVNSVRGLSSIEVECGAI